MKKTIIIAIVCLASVLSFAQEIIQRTDGVLITGKIKEINETHIVYTREDQPEGPIRKISIENVSEIRYQNGSVEHFTNVGTKHTESQSNKSKNDQEWEPGSINNTGEVVIIPRPGPDKRVQPGERFPGGGFTPDRLFRSGLYLDGIIGYGTSGKRVSNYNYLTGNNYSYSTLQNVSFGVRLGTKHLFGQHERHRFGLNMAWVGITGLLNENGSSDIIFAPVNIGFASVFKSKTKENTGFEFNTSTGLVLSTLYSDAVGVKYGFDIKYRYNVLAVGLDLSRTDTVFGSRNENATLVGITAGFKF